MLIIGVCTQISRVGAATPNVVGLQLRDDSCGNNNGLGSAQYASDVGKWTPWTGDADDFDPDCIKAYLGGSIPQDTDIRIGIQARDINTPCGFLWLFKCGDGGGTVTYTPWVSASGVANTAVSIWTSNPSTWATDADSWDPDQWRFIIDTQPWYGYTVRDYKIGIRVGDMSADSNQGCTEQIGNPQYTASSTNGVSWTGWASDNVNNSNFNCVRANLIASSTLNDPTAAFTGTTTVDIANSVNIPWDVEYIDTSVGCTLVGKDGGGATIDGPRPAIKANGVNSTTSIAITVPTTYTLTCPGLKPFTSTSTTRTVSPISQPATMVFTMNPKVGLAAGSTTEATISAANVTSCTLRGYDSNYNVVDSGYTYAVPPPSAIITTPTSYAAVDVKLTSGSSWTPPTSPASQAWNSADNYVEVIGGGGGGGGQNNGFGNTGGGGGGGGAYSSVTNLVLTPGVATPYAIGAGGSSCGGSCTGGTGGSTWFKSSSVLLAVGGAGGVSGGNGGAGGSLSSGVGTVKSSGGNGGNHGNYSGGGGGGAGGPHGNGKNGGAGNNQTGANGGAGDNGSGGAGGSGAACCTNNNAGAGGAGSISAGYAGGGGGGGADNTNTSNTVGAGGSYGGGAGGDGDDSACCSRAGTQGVIHIHYVPPDTYTNTLADNTDTHTSTHTVSGTTNYVVSCVPYGGGATIYATTTITLSSCSLNGVVIANGGSANFYSESSAPSGHTCSEYGPVVRGCSGGTLTGNSSYVYSSCAEQSSLVLQSNGHSPTDIVRKGITTPIYWDGGNSDSCTLVGSDGFTSSEITATIGRVITQKTVYTLSCSLGARTSTATLTINVLPTIIEI